MKHYLILTAASLALFLSGYTQYGHSHSSSANRHLSNLLKPTAVNGDLLPCSDNKINLGSANKNWKDFYLTGNIYKGHNRFLSSDSLGNTFLGISAGKFNTGSGNTAVGDNAMFNNTTGSYSTSFGYHALSGMKESIYNTAFGYMALSNSTGSWNSAFGTGGLANTTTGEFNAASGNAALYNNTEGYANTAVGIFALLQNTTGSGNTGIGQSALWTNETNSNNTAIGNESTGNSLDYANATFLGALTNADSGVTNATAIGFGALAKKSNQVVVGNTEVTSIGGFANWSNFSDGRYKKNIKEDVPGLEFISQLRPVTYTLDVDGIEKANTTMLQRKRNLNISGLDGSISIPSADFNKSEKQKSQELKSKQEKEKIVYTGFIAQEVEQAAKKTNYDFSGVDKPQTGKGFYALRYGDFIVPLVKAVQEQQKQIEQQQKQIDELKTLVQSITKQSVSNAAVSLPSSTASLKQNAPNPFSKSTVISYTVSPDADNAQIVVTGMMGNLIKTFTATKGEGQVNINSGELPAATYNYTLFVNGKKVDTKQMVLTK